MHKLLISILIKRNTNSALNPVSTFYLSTYPFINYFSQDLVERLNKGDLTVGSEKANILTEAQKVRIALARYIQKAQNSGVQQALQTSGIGHFTRLR